MGHLSRKVAGKNFRMLFGADLFHAGASSLQHNAGYQNTVMEHRTIYTHIAQKPPQKWYGLSQ